MKDLVLVHHWVYPNNKVVSRTKMPDIRCLTESAITTSISSVISTFYFTYRFPLRFTKHYIYLVPTVAFE